MVARAGMGLQLGKAKLGMLSGVMRANRLRTTSTVLRRGLVSHGTRHLSPWPVQQGCTRNLQSPYGSLAGYTHGRNLVGK